MNKSSKFIIILLVIILIAVLGVGGYTIYKLNEKLDEKDNNSTIVENVSNSNSSVVTNDIKEENSVKNSDNNNNENTISTEEKIRIAFYLGNFDSIDDVSDEDIISTLISRNSYYDATNINVLSYNETNSQSAQSLFKGIDYSEYNFKIFEYNESDIKKVAKEIFGRDLPTGVVVDNDYLKYSNGKYYYMYIPTGGEWLTIRNIKQNGNTYEYLALSALDSDEADDSEFLKYEVVIVNGVIKSAKQD
jgi:hypothetical protein